MKKISVYLSAGFLLLSCMIFTKSYSQTRLPDGTIIYQDGTKRLPNGTMLHPNGTTTTNRTVGGIFHPRNTTVNTNRYPRRNNTVYTNRYPRRNNVQHMPPGQAKKIYGGEARDYAPGHNKGNGNNNNRRYDNNQGDNGNGNRRSDNDHGEHGNGGGQNRGHEHGKH